MLRTICVLLFIPGPALLASEAAAEQLCLFGDPQAPACAVDADGDLAPEEARVALPMSAANEVGSVAVEPSMVLLLDGDGDGLPEVAPLGLTGAAEAQGLEVGLVVALARLDGGSSSAAAARAGDSAGSLGAALDAREAAAAASLAAPHAHGGLASSLAPRDADGNGLSDQVGLALAYATPLGGDAQRFALPP